MSLVFLYMETIVIHFYYFKVGIKKFIDFKQLFFFNSYM